MYLLSIIWEPSLVAEWYQFRSHRCHFFDRDVPVKLPFITNFIYFFSTSANQDQLIPIRFKLIMVDFLHWRMSLDYIVLINDVFQISW